MSIITANCSIIWNLSAGTMEMIGIANHNIAYQLFDRLLPAMKDSSNTVCFPMNK